MKNYKIENEIVGILLLSTCYKGFKDIEIKIENVNKSDFRSPNNQAVISTMKKLAEEKETYNILDLYIKLHEDYPMTPETYIQELIHDNFSYIGSDKLAESAFLSGVEFLKKQQINVDITAFKKS